MSLFKDAKEFFGLVPPGEEHDEAYYDRERYADERPVAYSSRYDAAAEDFREREAYVAPARGVAVGAEPSAHTSSIRRSASRTYVPAVVAVEPRSYSEAASIGEPFRDGDAVTFELTDLAREDAKRFIDFAAGLCFASRGSMHNLSKGVETDRKIFCVVPEGADISVRELQQAAGLIR